MKINYWACEYSDAEEIGGIDYDFEWCYFCIHPDNKTGLCNLENKWCNNKDEYPYCKN